MVRRPRPRVRTSRLLAPFVALVTLSAAMVTSSGSSVAQDAQGTQGAQVSGGAFGHWTNVSLFGGPKVPVGPAPDVRLPPEGSATPMTGNEKSAEAVYGPAHIFGGKWPVTEYTAPPSGPIAVSTQGTTGPNASVTSTVDFTLREPPDPKSPGGFGPEPPTQGDELHSKCTAGPGGPTGSVTIKNGVVSHATDSEGEPTEETPLPENPPPNYTDQGVLTNVGDRYKLVYNEQFIEPDGSITVNAIHMYLLGDIAVGDQILGQVRCSVTGFAFQNVPAPVAKSGGGDTQNFAGTDPEPEKPLSSSKTNVVPFVLGGVGAVLLIGIVVAVLVTRKRKRAKGEAQPVDGL